MEKKKVWTASEMGRKGGKIGGKISRRVLTREQAKAMNIAKRMKGKK